MARTAHLGSEGTQQLAGRRPEDTDRIQLNSSVTFAGQFGTYEITTEFLAMGGESQLYFAVRESDKVRLVAKIYDEFVNNPANRAAKNAISAFLMKSRADGGHNLMPLLDYGYVDLIPLDGNTYQMPVDIIPYFRNTSLEQTGYTSLRSTVIPSITYALHYMHSANIVHRDLKPENIFWHKGQIYIGDFGTASEILTVESQSSRFIGTKRKRGTIGYTAPEVWQGFATPASDYFSLGCTIASLYNGEHVYQSLIETKDEGAINHRMRYDGLPLSCPAGEEDLQLLVDSLTIMEQNDRAGYEDVIQWLEDPQAFAKKWAKKKTVTQPTGFRFIFENQVCESKEELSQAMLNDWDKAKDYLYSGGAGAVGTSAIVTFFSTIDQSLAVNASRIVNNKETANNFDLGLARFLHFLNDSNCPIFWKGRTYQQLADLVNHSQNKESAHDLIELLEADFLSWKYENTPGFNTPETVKSLKRVESLSKKDSAIACELFGLTLSAEPEKVRRDSIEEIDRLLSQAPYFFYEIWPISHALLAKFVFLGFEQDVLQYTTRHSRDPRKDNDLIYLLLESVSDNKIRIREYYLNFGTLAPYAWLKRNLNLYTPHSQEALNLFRRIETIDLSHGRSISELRSVLAEIRSQMTLFTDLFQNDLFLATLGINLEKDVLGITSIDLDAYFLEDFQGERVPLGFVRHLYQPSSDQY